LPGFECVERHSTFSIFKSGNLTITYFRSDFTVVPTDDIIWFDCCGGWAKKVLNPFFDEVNNTEKTNRLIFVTASPLVRNYKTCHEFLVKEDRLFFDREDAFRDMYESEIKGDKTKILDYSYYGGESESEEEEGNLHCPMICVGFHTIKDSKLSLRQHIGKNKQLTSYKQYVS